jgi:hypothetical protein
MINIIDFFTYLTGLNPTPDQCEFLNDCVNKGIHKLLISAGRQSGKTLCSAVAVLWFVFEYPEPLKILLVSAQQNILYLHMLDIFRKCGDFRFKNIKQGGQILEETPWNIVPLKGFTTQRGTIVYVRGSTDKQIRGIPADIVVLDECCEIKNDIVLTAMGNISGEISKFIVLSTPHVDASLFVKWATTPEDGFKVHLWNAEGLSWHSKEIDDTKKKEYSKEKYAVEMLGRPPTKAERAFFPSKHIEKCVLPVEPIREGGANSRVEVGIDFGGVTVLIVTERIGTTVRKILYIKHWKGKPIEMTGPEMLKIISDYKTYVSKGDSKPPEYKQWFINKAKGKVKFIDMALGHKEQALGQLQRMVREHRLIIPQTLPWATDLMIALKKYRMVKGEDAKSAGSDFVEALALSIYEPSIPLEGGSYGRVYFPEQNGKEK